MKEEGTLNIERRNKHCMRGKRGERRSINGQGGPAEHESKKKRNKEQLSRGETAFKNENTPLMKK